MESIRQRQEREILERYESAPFDRAAAGAPQGLSRRSFIRQSLGLAGGLTLGTMFDEFLGRAAFGQQVGPGYGPLTLKADLNTGLNLLALPEGFQYVSFGWSGDPMRGGLATPNWHDGMAVFQVDPDHVVLIRNHEIDGPGAAYRGPIYDAKARGGTTNVLFNLRTMQVESAWASLAGTVRNCAGGATPWDTWLTCEETGVGTGNGYDKSHGWVFEVSPFGYSAPVPLWDMGRFSHEALAVDPQTGWVYLTEDSGDSGLYRFIPNTRGVLRDGGRLQMLRVVGRSRADLGLIAPAEMPFAVDADWVDIPDPSNNTYSQGSNAGGARFARLEGAWYGDGKIYFDSTSGGPVDPGGPTGQIWEYTPDATGLGGVLRLVFQSPSRSVLAMPDNLAVSPRTGGLVLCEDSGRTPERLHILSPDGLIAPFAENQVIIPSANNPKPLIQPGTYRNNEWAGATFFRDSIGRQVLFVNIQTPGISFAIAGPWENGGL